MDSVNIGPGDQELMKKHMWPIEHLVLFHNGYKTVYSMEDWQESLESATSIEGVRSKFIFIAHNLLLYYSQTLWYPTVC